jgi:ERCC4-type nuclease
MEIIVDDREQAILPYLEDQSNTYHIDYKIQRNEVGDYAICYKGFICVIIERKTWLDLSASMRDGRKDNVKKLLKLREDTGCQIAYLIEGDATPPFNKKFGRLPLKNLRAHLDHIAFRDQIHMIYSRNQEYTAERLFELAKNYLSLDLIKELDHKEKTVTGGNTEKLKEHQASAVSVKEQVLRCIPGIGSVISAILATNDISIKMLYESTTSEETLLTTTETIAQYKYNTGAILGLAKANKIMSGVKRLFTSSSEASHKSRVRLLTTIPLISKATAEKLLDVFNLLDILDGTLSAAELARFQKTEKAKLGQKAASNIIQYLCE